MVSMLREFFSKSALVVTLCGAVLGYQAHAADENGKFAVRGAGSQQCKELLSFLKSSEASTRREAIIIYDAWLAGYASHVNRVAENTYDISPVVNSLDMLNLLIQQCERNPDAVVETIVSGVLAALSDAKIESESGMVTIGDGKDARDYRRATIIAVQRKLDELGILNGRADGRYGPKTAASLRAFQKSRSLPETGHLDSRTLLSLLLG